MKNEFGHLRMDKKQAFYFFLPIVLLPFLTLLFWAMGGGGSGEKSVEEKGLNTRLPEAHVKREEGFNKLSFYERIKEESPLNTPTTDSFPATAKGSWSYDPTPYGIPGYRNEGEEELSKKLESLGRQLGGTEKGGARGYNPRLPHNQPPVSEKGEAPTEDVELTQINNLMDKIIRIQEPQSGRETNGGKTNGKVTEPPLISLLSVDIKEEGRGAFLGVQNEVFKEENSFENTVAVSVDGDQVIGDGGTVKLRLMEWLTVKGIRIPEGTAVWGVVRVAGDRFSVGVHSIRSGKAIVSLSGTLWDVDGLPGIRKPKPFKENVLEGKGEDLLDIDPFSLEPSVKVRAAGAGMEALKNLARKSSRSSKIKLPGGYALFLQYKD